MLWTSDIFETQDFDLNTFDNFCLGCEPNVSPQGLCKFTKKKQQKNKYFHFCKFFFLSFFKITL